MLNRPHSPKQLIILSGKGGTGKTSISAAFAHLASLSMVDYPPVVVDADVDAANLGLVLEPVNSHSHDFWGGSLAQIDPDLCSACGSCADVCRYDAALPDPQKPGVYWIDPVACDGCAACVYACPNQAIRMLPQQEGNWFSSTTAYGPLFHAELFAGKENSGKLVTLIKQHARLYAEDEHAPMLLIDGPPGIGCPVISACAGTNLGLIITEPGQAGLHDLKRVLGVLQHFRVPALICINKADIYPQGTADIHAFASQSGIEVIGEIPYDATIPRAMVAGKPITLAYPQAPASQAIIRVWERVKQNLFDEKEAV
jgi:MinD superfamily P-loop ATPase